MEEKIDWKKLKKKFAVYGVVVVDLQNGKRKGRRDIDELPNQRKWAIAWKELFTLYCGCFEQRRGRTKGGGDGGDECCWHGSWLG